MKEYVAIVGLCQEELNCRPRAAPLIASVNQSLATPGEPPAEPRTGGANQLTCPPGTRLRASNAGEGKMLKRHHDRTWHDAKEYRARWSFGRLSDRRPSVCGTAQRPAKSAGLEKARATKLKPRTRSYPLLARPLTASTCLPRLSATARRPVVAIAPCRQRSQAPSHQHVRAQYREHRRSGGVSFGREGTTLRSTMASSVKNTLAHTRPSGVRLSRITAPPFHWRAIETVYPDAQSRWPNDDVHRSLCRAISASAANSGMLMRRFPSWSIP